jgi:hypothetical protein
VLRLFGPKKDEMTGGWRKLHNEELHDLYSSPSIIRIIKSRRIWWAEHVARMEEKNVYRVLAGKPEGTGPRGRPRRKWLDNTKMCVVERVWDGVDWIDLAQSMDKCRALANSVMNLRVPQNSGKLSSGFTTFGLSSSAQLRRFRQIYIYICKG